MVCSNWGKYGIQKDCCKRHERDPKIARVWTYRHINQFPVGTVLKFTNSGAVTLGIYGISLITE